MHCEKRAQDLRTRAARRTKHLLRLLMSPKPLPIVLTAICAVALIWRMASLQSEVTGLRNAITPLNPTAASASDSPKLRTPSHETNIEPEAQASELEQTRQKLDEANERIAALEDSVDALSDAWNNFAEDEALKRKRASMRSWGPEQITGPPDTLTAGDRPTAWASQAADGGMEWLQADYAQPVEVAQVRVLENDNPGAVVRITGTLENGGEVVLWQGNEPRLPAPADQVFNVPAGYRVRSVRVHLDTAKVPGWNEIDAVELIGRDGTRQWATGASASSTYASPRGRQGFLTDTLDLGFQLSK